MSYNMKVLVTGGAGFIASCMVYLLLDNGYHVEVIDNLTTGRQSQLPKNVKLHICDIGNCEKVNKIMKDGKFDAVFHFAASIIVPESVQNPIKYYYNNTLQTFNFLKSCVDNKIKYFIFSSTAAVYESNSEKKLNENSITKPSSPYGMSKLMSENMIKDILGSYNISFIIFRYFNVAGADRLFRCGQQNQNSTHLIKVGCEVVLNKRKKLSIFGNDYNTSDGTGVRDYIHVDDLVNAHLKGLLYLKSKKTSLILNCGYGKGYSVKKVVEMFNKVSNGIFKTEIVSRRLGDPASVVADNSLILELLNWRPQFDDLEIIIRDSLEWEKKIQT